MQIYAQLLMWLSFNKLHPYLVKLDKWWKWYFSVLSSYIISKCVQFKVAMLSLWKGHIIRGKGKLTTVLMGTGGGKEKRKEEGIMELW